jgi:NADH:ubiquinone oxidoreductase subunit H
MFVIFLVLVLLLLMGVAFITLFERHVLAIRQGRRAPLKAGFFGMAQPLLDGFKLFKKEVFCNFFVFNFYFFLVPFLTFFAIVLEWGVLPYVFFFFNFEMSYLFLLCLVGGLVYMMLLLGVYRKSKYALLGAIRSSCQRVSFEVVFFFFLFCFMGLVKRFTIVWIFNFFLVLLIPFFSLIVLVELNRPPFDFREGERELVRGFNLELGGFLFVLLFLREYGFLLFFRYFVSVLGFLGSWLGFFGVFVFFLGIRRSFPRYRYDKMMGLFWFNLLPLVIFVFFFVYVLLFRSVL